MKLPVAESECLRQGDGMPGAGSLTEVGNGCGNGLGIKVMWEFIPEGKGYLYSAVLAADADNDGECEVFVGSFTYSMYCLNGKDGTVKWSYKLPDGQYVGCNNLSLADVNGDGKYELVFATEGKDPTLYVLKTDEMVKDRLLWSQPLSGAFLSMGLAVFQDTDSHQKILAITRSVKGAIGKAHLFDGCTGKLIWGPLGEEDCCGGPVVADLNGDGFLEFVYGNHTYRGHPHDGCVVCRHVKDGTVLWTYKTAGDPGANTMSLCDIDDNGKPEIVVSYTVDPKSDPACQYGSVALAGDGREVWKRNIWAGQKVCIGSVKGEKVICGGGYEDNHKELQCLNADSGEVRWAKTLNGGCKGSPVAVDINNDGIDEFIVGDADNNLFIVSGADGHLLFHARYTSGKTVREETRMGIHNIALADVDNDGCWNILFNSADGTTRCLRTNMVIQSGMRRVSLMNAGTVKRMSNVDQRVT